LNFAQEINNAVQATMPVESSSPINEHNLVPDVCPISTPKSAKSSDTDVSKTRVYVFLLNFSLFRVYLTRRDGTQAEDAIREREGE
jgi:hypothetical protein